MEVDRDKTLRIAYRFMVPSLIRVPLCGTDGVVQKQRAAIYHREPRSQLHAVRRKT
jgi:hypothetical protein